MSLRTTAAPVVVDAVAQMRGSLPILQIGTMYVNRCEQLELTFPLTRGLLAHFTTQQMMQCSVLI
jgi:hypothetical protein